LTSAFGITTAIQNIGMAFGPILVTFVHDKTINYKHGFFAVSVLNSI